MLSGSQFLQASTYDRQSYTKKSDWKLLKIFKIQSDQVNPCFKPSCSGVCTCSVQGKTLRGRSRRRSGGLAQDSEGFSKICKCFLIKLQNENFSIFSRTFKKLALNLRAFRKNTNCWEHFWENIKKLNRFNGKIGFSTTFGKVFDKNRTVENNIRFQQPCFSI